MSGEMNSNQYYQRDFKDHIFDDVIDGGAKPD